MGPSIASFLLQSVIILPIVLGNWWLPYASWFLTRPINRPPKQPQWCRGTPKRSHPCWTSLRSVFFITWRAFRNRHQTSIGKCFPVMSHPRNWWIFFNDLWLPWLPISPQNRNGEDSENPSWSPPSLRYCNVLASVGPEAVGRSKGAIVFIIYV